MTNDLQPVPEPAPIERFIRSLNLPEVIAGPAGKALSRLVAGILEVPQAYLDDFVQAIKNKTEAKKVVNTEVATAAAKLAANDHDIVARAAHNLLAKEYRRQANKEDIVKKTIELLQDEGAVISTEQREPSTSEYVDDDWLNVFERYSEDASSERLQTLWARILAGEIRKPKTFSLHTLRFLSELDEETAKLFQKYSERVLVDTIPFPPREGLEFGELLALEEAGLVAGANGMLSKILKARPGPVVLPCKEHAIVIECSQEIDIRIDGCALTRVGKELYKLISTHDNVDNGRKVVERLSKAGINRILWTEAPPPQSGPTALRIVEVLWTKPPDPPTS